ncbi:MAG: SUMF1/EgtB/PvdO family nonheme iron enzyme [Planctomycetaceae bacterium]|nr:SUMF1/EgtB/PvdO family nonheme iron enzyme [Planctomycetaceae bacterium]
MNSSRSRQVLLLSACVVSILRLSPVSLLADDGVGKYYAILVGVEDYQHHKLREPNPLKYSVDDVTALAEILKRENYEVLLLTDETGKKSPGLLPTRANIEARIREAVEKCRNEDTILIALTGHGLQFSGNKDAFFCPIDARPFASETKTLVSVSGIYEELEKSFAGVKVILVDACRNDPDPGRGRGLDADSAPPPPKGVAALFSCSAGQRAFEHDEFKHGVFFHHVLEGLGGEAANRDGNVTFDSLSAYVRGEVPKTMRRLLPGHEQFPNLKADLVGRPPVLARVTVPSLPAKRELTKPKMERPKSTPSPTGIEPELAIAPFDAMAARQHQEAWAKHLNTDVEITNSIGMKLTLIPPGEFLMGSDDNDAGDDEKPVHTVHITKPYFLGTTEVTQGQWKAVMGSTPWKGQEYVKEGDDYPATHISHEDAEEFCQKLSKQEGKTYRLPTEAEWENACRAGTQSKYHYGDDTSDLGEYAWFSQNTFNIDEEINEVYGHRVGLKKPNPFGLHDMHGNVWEWCSDRYDEKYYRTSPKENPSGSSSGSYRVCRGGCWYGVPVFCRSAFRVRDAPSSRDRFLGFRLARVP